MSRILTMHKRLFLGFGIILLLTAGVLCLYHLGFRVAVHGFEKLIFGEMNLTRLAGEINGFALQCRDAEENFLVRNEKKALDIFAGNMISLKGTLSKVENIGRELENEEIIARAAAIREGVEAYETAFQDVSTRWPRRGWNYSSGLQGQCRENASKVEEALGSSAQAEAAVLLLRMRTSEKDYLLRGDEEYVEKTYAGMDELLGFIRDQGFGEASMPGMGQSLAETNTTDIAQDLSEADITDIEEALGAYRTVFDALVAEDKIIKEVTRKMRAAFAKVGLETTLLVVAANKLGISLR
ncbi:MAG: hypothetical protein JXD19_07775, partial [Deltaproteobacteria bacterium]|nr:hypothetical protein [Deltaproteobacteria bacterium]